MADRLNKARAYAWPLALMVTVTIVSGTNNLATPPGFTWVGHDKVAHVLVFGLIATTILRLPVFRTRQGLGMVAAIVLTSLFGALDEWRQSFTPGRFVEFDDWIADTVGAIIATMVYRYWPAYRGLLERSARKKSV